MTDLSILSFAARLGVALVFGALIGLERQWRHRMAGTRTNALVAGGAAAFVMSGVLVPGDATAQGRIVSYVVSAVGFLGAGVIFKQSAQVRGLNTAATIWCSAAVGVVTGLGYVDYAAVVMAGVLLANTALRPLAYKLHPPEAEPESEEACYHVKLTCRSQEESRVRSLLLQTVNRLPCALYALRSQDQPSGVLVDADVRLAGRSDEVLEQIVTRLSLEECVCAISWKLLPASGEHTPEPGIDIQEET